MNTILYRISRYWNRLAFAVVHLGRRMIWDQTGRSKDLLEPGEFVSETTEGILCDK